MNIKLITTLFSIILVSCIPINPKTETGLHTPIASITQLMATKTTRKTNTPIPSKTFTPSPNPTKTQVPKERSKYDEVSGTYQYGNNYGARGMIRVIFEQQPVDENSLIPHPFDVIGFEILYIHGAPSYNSGYAISKISMTNHLAVYSPNDACYIVLMFRRNEIEVTQIGLDFDCGFGHSVYVDGIYKLIDPTPPELGCLDELGFPP
jgi:hypothetical protein